MAIRNVVQVGDETLRKVSFPVEAFDENCMSFSTT